MKAALNMILVLTVFPIWGQQIVAPIADSLFSVPKNLDFNHDHIQPAIRKVIDPKHCGKDSAHANVLVIQLISDSYAQYDTAFRYRASVGFQGEWISKKWHNRTRFLSGWNLREDHRQDHAFLLPLHNRNAYWYNDFRTRFSYTHNDVLQTSFGIDQQFYGEGYRSLLQGDQIAPNPFAQMRVKFWRLEYGLLYQFLHEQDSTRYLKFQASHYLSWNVTNKWNITFYEAVLFQPKDGNLKRGFEIEYLNPIAFFRPQEYSLGSADNVLLGAHTHIRLLNHTIYGQLSLDEFVLGEIRNRTRWWANKYGVQLGLKGKLGKLEYRLEGNVIRPYTYSHINFGQNSGQLGRPMGHPLGSNFAEILAQLQTRYKLFHVMGYAVFQLKGYDSDTVSWGGDVYKPYTMRPATLEYGNTIGQGTTIRSFELGLSIQHPLPAVPLQAYCQIAGKYSWGDISARFDPILVLGIRSALFSPRRLF
jgi:hypothetical protein